MTTLLARIADDLATSRREGRIADRDGLLFLLAEARVPGKLDGSRDSTDAEVIRVIRKQIAACVETIEALSGTARENGPEHAKADADIRRLTSYLPPQMNEDDLTQLISAFITGQNWTDEPKSMKWMGTVMEMLRECRPGQYDPAMASRVARSLLQS